MVDPAKYTSNTVFLDMFFSPIKNISIEISNAVSGDSVENDRLDITIETNGIISPKIALGHAAYINRQFMSVCVDFEEKSLIPQNAVPYPTSNIIDYTEIFNKKAIFYYILIKSITDNIIY